MQYEKIRIIGQGTYSEMYEYFDLTNNEIVAVKKITKNVHEIVNKTREMDLLQRMNHNIYNIVRYEDQLFFKMPPTIDKLNFGYPIVRLREVQQTDMHWYLILDHVDTNLKNYMESNPDLGNDQNQIRVSALSCVF